jgi:hypothetical protein
MKKCTCPKGEAFVVLTGDNGVNRMVKNMDTWCFSCRAFYTVSEEERAAGRAAVELLKQGNNNFVWA